MQYSDCIRFANRKNYPTGDVTKLAPEGDQLYGVVADLSEKLNVSEDTICRDPKELSDEGVIVKVQDGAMSKPFHSPFDVEAGM